MLTLSDVVMAILESRASYPLAASAALVREGDGDGTAVHLVLLDEKQQPLFGGARGHHRRHLRSGAPRQRRCGRVRRPERDHPEVSDGCRVWARPTRGQAGPDPAGARAGVRAFGGGILPASRTRRRCRRRRYSRPTAPGSRSVQPRGTRGPRRPAEPLRERLARPQHGQARREQQGHAGIRGAARRAGTRPSA